MKWWAQSYLSGVPRITCGFRDDDGICDDIQHFNTLDLPLTAQQIRNSWDSETCLCFLDNFLEFIKSIFKKINDHTTVLLVNRDINSLFLSYQVLENSSEQFLPDWFVNEFHSKNKSEANRVGHF